MYLNGTSAVTNGGAITCNETGSGAGVYIICGTNQTIKTGLTINSGTISNNVSSARGGGFFAVGQNSVGGFLTMNGGITNNSAAIMGGHVRLRCVRQF